MDIDDDDDFYAPEEATVDDAAEQRAKHSPVPANTQTRPKSEQQLDDLEEGEEQDEEEDEDESDSDIDIITERKDGTKPAPPVTSRYNEIRNVPQRSTSGEVKPAAVKKEKVVKELPSGADLPAVATSKIDVNADPVYSGAGKPITQVDIDSDLADNEKPWRRPGTDITDYFNFGFDEFTWALYAAKQNNLRGEYDQTKIAENNKKMFEDMNMMMMGGMPGMNGAAAASLPGMEGIPPEMQQMMQQMMASGMDPSQMDPAAMFAGMTGQVGAGGAGNNQNTGFGGQQGFQGQAQQQNYGFDQPMMDAGSNASGGNMGRGGGRGNFRGRGRAHRNW